ncbi:hypothetical protein [Propionivibrio sp.]
MNAEQLKAAQAPLKASYKENPQSALWTLSAPPLRWIFDILTASR